MLRRQLLLLPPLALLASCGATLTQDIILHHPAVSLKILKPEVVETSAPIEPVWIRKSEKTSAEVLPFVGQSFARTLDAAKQQAERDLLSAISNYVAVEVESEFESVETHESKGQEVHEEQTARNVVRTHSDSAIRDLKPDGLYWEKVVASPLTPENVSFRYYVHATVPRSEILRARLKKQLERRQATGRKSVVFLPFVPALDAAKSDALANAFVDEITHRLADDANLQISDPSMVLSVVGDRLQKSETETLEAVQDALLPDLVVRGSYQRVENRLKVSYLVYDAKEGRPIKTRSLDSTYEKLFNLEDLLTDALRKDLDTAVSAGGATGKTPKDQETRNSPLPTDNNLRAFEAYHEAYARYRAGDNKGALERIETAIALRPDYVEAYLRMGHILERIGRYGRLQDAQHPRQDPAEAPPPWAFFACLGETRAKGERGRRPERPAEPDGGERAQDAAWRDRAVGIDQILEAVMNTAGADAPVVRPPPAAADAYVLAIRFARQAGDHRLDAEAMLALAELATRVDRPAQAIPILARVRAYAAAVKDANLENLALFAGAVASYKVGDVGSATSSLHEALKARILLGEKPYLVEIYNQLARIAVDTSELHRARALYAKAQRIAKQLGNDYIAAVLSNNIGVLEYHLGQVAAASEDFDRAWEYLHQVDEAEGQISSGLNLVHIGAFLGDFDRAKESLGEVERLIEKTRQQERRAELLTHRGVLAELAGEDAIPALRDSWYSYQALPHARAELRLRNNIGVAEFSQTIRHADTRPWREALSCIRNEMELTRGLSGYTYAWGALLERGTDGLIAHLNAIAIRAVAP